MDWIKRIKKLGTNKSWSSISVHRNLSRTRTAESYDNPKRNNYRIRNRHYKYLYSIIAILIGSPSYAETIGGVSATASPVANSSGSVTNQAIQVLQGPYITNTYGGGIQCQGPTLNFTPYVTGSVAAARPYEAYYDDPVYDISDNFGAIDNNGNEIGDGIIDNPGRVLYTMPTRTGQKDNYSLSIGFSATWSRPLDKTLQDQCKQAVATQIDLQRQLIANKRLDFELARLKTCGQLIKDGISFHPRSPYYKTCADVVVQNVNHIKEHRHYIPAPVPVSKNASDLGGPISSSNP